MGALSFLVCHVERRKKTEDPFINSTSTKGRKKTPFFVPLCSLMRMAVMLGSGSLGDGSCRQWQGVGVRRCLLCGEVEGLQRFWVKNRGLELEIWGFWLWDLGILGF